MAGSSEPVGAAVKAFYETLPFNYHGSVEEAARHVSNNSVAEHFPDLHQLLADGGIRSVYEFGCGAGWLSNAIALHYGTPVTAIDFSSVAILRARAVAAQLRLQEPPSFLEQDLFESNFDSPADLVISMGVLHHTADARSGFEQIALNCRSGGHIHVGLYHEYGRREFLALFQEILDSQGEQAALDHYARLTRARGGDQTHLRSWFRDQVTHPHESTHTLQEVGSWLKSAGCSLVSTSINKFAPFDSLEELHDLEQHYAQISRRANRDERRYFPGFFTILARKH